jgi:SAM-dependent methyltransferase
MKVFGNYARYYDLLYQQKDYNSEADYIASLLKKFAPSASSILELGSGTGKHAICLAKKGLTISGVDLSEEMVVQATKRTANLEPELAKRVDFTVADIRLLKMDRRFDAAISLFHVLSYQTTNDDIRAFFRTAKNHLNPGGVFIFDFWYTPAVLTQKPQRRELTLEDDVIHVQRLANPEMFYNANCVEVNYDLTIRDKATDEIEKIQECHRMRYLSLPEIQHFLKDMNMDLIFSHGWMRHDDPSTQTWAACCGAALTK